MVSAEQRRALVCVDRGMLAFPYHVRYELMEFAIYTLVPRVLGLVPLHGAAVASHGRAVLLTGPAGSGKSTAFLNCALSGLELLSEDAVFLEPRSLRATGCANFLHLRTDGMEAVRDPDLRAAIRRSPVIRRRSGVRKFEYDIRRSTMRVAPHAPRLAAVIAAVAASCAGARLLEPLSPAQALRWLRREQPYARAQDSWADFCHSLAGVPPTGCCAANIPKTRPTRCAACWRCAPRENSRWSCRVGGSLGRGARHPRVPRAHRTARAPPRRARVRVAPGVAARHLAARRRDHSQRRRPFSCDARAQPARRRTPTRALRPGASPVLGRLRVRGLRGRCAAGRPFAVHVAGGELSRLPDIGYGGRRSWPGRCREALVLRRAAAGECGQRAHDRDAAPHRRGGAAHSARRRRGALAGA
jgi:hypothetical protein